MDNIVIIGSSGHAKVIADVVENQGKYKISGFVDSTREIGEQVVGYRVLGSVENLPELLVMHDIRGALVGIGDNFVRSTVVGRIRDLCPRLSFVTAIHPNSSIGKEASVGEGAVVMAGAVVNPCSSIGRFCILNTNSSLDHDSAMEDFASLAPNVVTGGNCRIGTHSAVSIGASLVHGVTIGQHTVVGAGSTVLGDIGPYSVAYGTPAKTIRERSPGDKYL